MINFIALLLSLALLLAPWGKLPKETEIKTEALQESVIVDAEILRLEEKA